MPRSLSTLLQCILNQNPTILATPTDPVLEFLYAARANYSSTPEAKAMNQTLAREVWRGFCHGGLYGYAHAYSDKPNLCIKTRGASIHYRWFQAFMTSKPKMVCMVRDMRCIMASMEKIFRKGAESHQPIQNHVQMTGTTTQKRVAIWASSQPVGMACERLQQTFLEGISKEMLFIKAEDLTGQPAREMQRLYDYLELPYYPHNFDHVPQTVHEDDSVYGLGADLHTIRSRVMPLKDDSLEILGAETCQWIDGTFAWYQHQFGYQPL